MSMRGMWYVFRAHDGVGLYQAVADQVREVMAGPGGWLILFRGSVPNQFLSRKEYAAPYLSKRVKL